MSEFQPGGEAADGADVDDDGNDDSRRAATDAAADALHVLLIEDNPGDARLIEERLRNAEELTQRVAPEADVGGPPELTHETRLEDGIDHLETAPVDVVLLDLNLPDSAGLDTVDGALAADAEVPVVVLTGLRDRDVGIQAIKRGAQDYLVKGEVTDDLLIRSIHHAIERHRQELERERRREQLEAINRLNEISQDVTHLVIRTSSTEDLQQRVCERLAADDGFRFAWIGELQRGSNEVVPTASAGVEEGYLDDVTIRVNDDDPSAEGPTARAIRTHEIQIMHNIPTDPRYNRWSEEATERGYRSSAAVPIVHDGLRYGVLNVYASRPEAFSDPEIGILAGLGDVIGHAIAAIERKDALVSDSALELEFRLGTDGHPATADDVARELLDLTRSADASVGGDADPEIRFDQLQQTDDSLLAYGKAVAIPQEEFLETAEDADWIDDVRALTRGTDEFEFELRTAVGASILETLATHGGRVSSATVADGDLRFVAELPHAVDTRRVVELVEESCPAVEYVAQRTTSRDDGDVADYDAVLEQQLTAKQREALETAVFAGYFDWPRTSTGEEVAERLDIAPATFTQHLRSAERKFFDEVFQRDDPE